MSLGMLFFMRLNFPLLIPKESSSSFVSEVCHSTQPFFIPCDHLFQSPDILVVHLLDIPTSHDSAPFIVMPSSSMPSSSHSLDTSNETSVTSVIPSDYGVIRYVPDESTFFPVSQLLPCISGPDSTSFVAYSDFVPSSISHTPTSSTTPVTIHPMLTRSKSPHQLSSSASLQPNQPPANTHTMITRSKPCSLQALTSIFPSSIHLVNKEPSSVHEALLSPHRVTVVQE